MKKILPSLCGCAVIALLATPTFAKTVLTADTAGSRGISAMIMLALAEVASENDIADIQVKINQTLTNSLQKVAEGKIDIASAPFIVAFLMQKGAGPYAKMGKQKGAKLIDNVQILFGYQMGVFSLYAYDSASVKGWDSVAGKRILNGPPRGGALTNARQILTAVTGLEDKKGYTGVQMNWEQMVQSISDNSVDAAILPIQFWNANVTTPLAAGNMTMWGMKKDIFESDAVQNLFKIPGSAPFVIKASKLNAPKGMTIKADTDGNYYAVATVGAVVANKDLDFETAKALVAKQIASVKKLKQNIPSMQYGGLGEVNTNAVCGANPLKYHPGAVAAWEQAGYTIPKCAKP